MSGWTNAQIWALIAVLGAGTWLIRFSFLGLIGDRHLPDWVLRHLRYTTVAVIPALIAPIVVWPPATGGTPDPARLAAAMVTVVVGTLTKNILAAIGAGMATLYLLLALL